MKRASSGGTGGRCTSRGGVLYDLSRLQRKPFAAATIQVEKEQKVISTGPYAIVRHPMYSGGIVMLLATRPALGSWWGLLVFIPLLPLLIWRLFNEEKFLSKNLSGYDEYCQNVRSRLIPRIF